MSKDFMQLFHPITKVVDTVSVDDHWMHKKSGKVVRIEGFARAQMDGEWDNSTLVLYRCRGEMYGRPITEFLDGRFSKMEEEK